MALQVAVLGWMVYDHSRPLASGERFLLVCEPVDPRDLMRGDYVTLGYGFQRLSKDEESALLQEWVATHPRDGKDDSSFQASVPDDTPVYIPLLRWANGIAGFGAPTLRKPTDGPFLLARKGSGSWGRGDLRAGIESYYVAEGTGQTWEKLRNQSNLLAEVAVLPSGQAGLVSLKDASKGLLTAVPYRPLERFFYQGKKPGSLVADLVAYESEFQESFHPAPLNGRNAVPPDFTQEWLISLVDKESDRQTDISIISVERLRDELVVKVKVSHGEKQTFTTLPQTSIIVRKEGLRFVKVEVEGSDRMFLLWAPRIQR
jgi:uncharacterized membrane-anchored protein